MHYVWYSFLWLNPWVGGLWAQQALAVHGASSDCFSSVRWSMLGLAAQEQVGSGWMEVEVEVAVVLRGHMPRWDPRGVHAPDTHLLDIHL